MYCQTLTTKDRESEADMLEWRTDLENGELPSFSKPWILSLRTRTEDISNYLAQKPAYVQVELQDLDFYKDKIKGYPLLLAQHVEHLDSLDLIDHLMSFDASLYKIAAFIEDPLLLMHFVRRVENEPRLIGIVMGADGTFSRALSQKLNNPITFVGNAAPGQLERSILEERFRLSSQTSKTKSIGLLGYPLHLSPGTLFHNTAFRREDLDIRYVNIPLKGDLVSFLKEVPDYFMGFSITMPLKKEAKIFALDPSAPSINTLKRSAKGWVGINTDGPGAIACLEKRVPLQDKKIAILGTGSTAQAIAWALDYKASLIPRKELVHFDPEPFDIIVQATKCGMEGDMLNLKSIPRNKIVLEVVLDETPFQKACAANGCHIIAGYDFFKAQATLQQEFWLEKSISLDPGPLPKCIEAPPSKSHTLRAILLASFAKGKSYIQNFLDAPDTNYIIQACRSLGASIKIENRDLLIEGTCSPKSGTYYLGNSGIALRFLRGILATFKGDFYLEGDASLMRRPMGPLNEALKTLHTGQVIVEGRDSQMVSSLIFAALFLKEPLKIQVKNPGELPWVNLTLKWLDRLGVSYKNRDFKEICVFGKGSIEGFNYTVPADFSSVSYPVAAALLTGEEIEIPNLDFKDSQGDKVLLDILEQMGAQFEKKEQTLRVLPNSHLEGMAIDVNPIIDALPLLAVMGCFAKGKTILFNGAIARTKECDRIKAIAYELKKMGAQIEELPDGLVIYESNLRGTRIDSHGDQRIVLALSLTALKTKEPLEITNYTCYTKTFPNFFRALNLKKDL